jgi:hypothetical protein
MKPGPSNLTLNWTTDKIREIVNAETRAHYTYAAAYAHELALRIRAHYGYDWLMLYKKERRAAARRANGPL